MEILRFGPGFRREPSQSGHGVAEQVIRSDARGSVTELAFASRAVLAPRSSPREGVFVVISGGGWVQVGEERAPVNHGEAVVWPAHVTHGAWTDGVHMRAVLIEFPDHPEALGLLHEGTATTVPSDAAAPPSGTARPRAGVTPARGGLAQQPGRPEEHDPAEGEPW